MLRSHAAGLTAERRQPEDGVGEGGAEEPEISNAERLPTARRKGTTTRHCATASNGARQVTASDAWETLHSSTPKRYTLWVDLPKSPA